ncbi:DUF72 domain-containing protein [Xanthomonas sp. WHRI 1810A]|uniref:DUF72 domain-containing protein n=1 Tax=Xanthomonas sp. WHRI 1810A TaxID=3161565 RepID=UPI0032E88F40
MMQDDQSPLYIGCAGWNLPRDYWPAFPPDGTHLQRYASVLSAVEINSAFYRPHRAQTYGRWAESVPPGFRFSVKLPKTITHEHRLVDCEALLDAFLYQCLHLGEALGCLLIQLPPSLAFEPDRAEAFFRALRQRYPGFAVVEPRHESWLQAHDLLIEYRIGQVAADPSRIRGGEVPGGWPGIRYWRWHGSPRIYHSAYTPEQLSALGLDAQVSAGEGVATWCIFDNTASGLAVGDALALQALMCQKRLDG